MGDGGELERTLDEAFGFDFRVLFVWFHGSCET